MNIPSDTIKTLLATLTGKSGSAAGEALTPDPAATLVPGREINAEVLERQPSGRYLVRAGKDLFDMPLPGELRPGTVIRLTYVGDTPRLTFSLSSQALKGSDVSLSSAGKWLGTLATDFPVQERSVPVQSARPPLISGELPLDRPLIASRLREAVARSGLFYESHIARWREGSFPLAELMEEPQAQESPILKGSPAKDGLPADGKALVNGPPVTSKAGTLSPPLPDQTPRQHHAGRLATEGRPDIKAGISGAETARVNGHPIPSGLTGTAETPETTGTAMKPDPSRAAAILPETAGREMPRPSHPGQPHGTTPAVTGNAVTEPLDQVGANPTPAAEAKTAPDHGTRTGQAATLPDQEAAPKSGASPQPLPPLLPSPVQGGDFEASRLTIPKQTAPERGETGAHPQRGQQGTLPVQHDTLPNRALPLAYGEPQATPLPDRPPREAFVITGDKAPSPLFEPPPPQTLPVIRQQLEFLQSGQFVWQGEAWKGQPFQWQIGREERKKGEARGNPWETSLNLELPNLGRISARLSLSGGDVRISVIAAAETAAGLMEKEKGKLIEGMEAAGLRLTGMEVRREPSS